MWLNPREQTHQYYQVPGKTSHKTVRLLGKTAMQTVQINWGAGRQASSQLHTTVRVPKTGCRMMALHGPSPTQ